METCVCGNQPRPPRPLSMLCVNLCMRHLSQRGICGLITPHMCGLITSSHHTPLPPISPCLYHATCGNLHAHAMHKFLKGVWVGCRCGSLLSLPSPVGGFWLLSLPPCWSLLSSRPCASLLSLPPHRAETLAPVGRMPGVQGVVAVR